MEQSELEVGVEQETRQQELRDPETVDILYPGMELNEEGKRILVRHLPETEVEEADEQVDAHHRQRSLKELKGWVEEMRQNARNEHNAWQAPNPDAFYSRGERFKHWALSQVSETSAAKYHASLDDRVTAQHRTHVTGKLKTRVQMYEQEVVALDVQYRAQRKKAANRTAALFREERKMSLFHDSREDAIQELDGLNNLLTAAYANKDESQIAALSDRQTSLIESITAFELAEGESIDRIAKIDAEVSMYEVKAERTYDKRQVVGVVLRDFKAKYDRLNTENVAEKGSISPQQLAADLDFIEETDVIMAKLRNADRVYHEHGRNPPQMRSLHQRFAGGTTPGAAINRHRQELTRDYNAALALVEERRTAYQAPTPVAG